LAVDRLARGADGTLLGQPDQKAPVDQGHAGAAALFARAALVAEAGLEISFHGSKPVKK